MRKKKLWSVQERDGECEREIMWKKSWLPKIKIDDKSASGLEKPTSSAMDCWTLESIYTHIYSSCNHKTECKQNLINLITASSN